MSQARLGNANQNGLLDPYLLWLAQKRRKCGQGGDINCACFFALQTKTGGRALADNWSLWLWFGDETNLQPLSRMRLEWLQKDLEKPSSMAC
ncbi:hypothetical protein PAAG_02495 [Paracoccidioides lutzii Pb01]|uniref:Uncharacterized protein n=1 Tax=Paracoccidioides lutzii (strain ATCC MYA-826 / Pb01) TaxID=502779 RepID=C1GV22_PARBA|nr:hypothetical protein PAAG_02495 [Paracoccidioides lutzii Pb01]EEH40440.2 hypothetical protein PAAG_02495 [Paracoccidioides lutzii Pb01]